MEFQEQLDIRIVDTVFDPDKYGVNLSHADIQRLSPEVRYDLSDGTTLYKVWVLLAGIDLPRVESVTYRLHETFPEPVRVVQRNISNQDARITVWTWGIFEINATILDKMGRSYSISHQMKYGDMLKEYSSQIKYIQEKPEPTTGATLIAS
jgi:hypothetical protein